MGLANKLFIYQLTTSLTYCETGVRPVRLSRESPACLTACGTLKLLVSKNIASQSHRIPGFANAASSPRRGVLLRVPGPRLSLLVTSVPDLEWLPALVQRLCEAGGYVRRIMPECGVVAALVQRDRAESVARALLHIHG